ncbi:GNAT family N-acetyltransferase [Phaeobacter porticola]|uniref:Acetyltransferase n=1 Tax=Phaeobacter porticola TaxID=1844006 RepID=A0A1L3I0V1_9RHOB|nr:GNAT family N-acetyltransferase [Phaeobacter porticola]APG45741.1 Acetyltransferase [Phaeobacter porticola]
MSVAIPTLETDRLILRAPSLADLEALCAFFASDRAEFVGGQMSQEQVWRNLGLEVGHWQLRGYGRWTVEEKNTGQAAGLIGLWFPDGWPEPEIGWDLFEGFGGKGYATEAAKVARTYAYDVLGWTTAISLIDANNHGSRALAQRLGAKQDGHFVHKRFGQVQVWRHPSPADLTDGGMEAYA